MKVFRQNFCDRKDDTTLKRLVSVVHGMMIRRVREDMLLGRKLVDLPRVVEETIEVTFTPTERVIYDIINKGFANAINE